MMGKLLPILMLLVGVGAGIGAGIVLAPAPQEEAHAEGAAGEAHGGTGEGGGDHAAEGEGDGHGDGHGEAAKPGADSHAKPAAKPAKAGGDGHGGGEGDEANVPDFVKLNNQFVVPVVASGKVEALVILTLSLETAPGTRDLIYDIEPKLRDAFLQVLFDHSNMGGFQGAFTRSNNLDILRGALLEVAQRQIGHGVHSVLIVDIARQDV